MTYKKIIAALIIFEIIFSAWLIYEDSKKQNVCFIGKTCDIVQSSDYGQIFGIKLPYLAIFAFTGLLILLYAKENWFMIATAIGALVSVYLIIVQLFILKQICTNCTIVDVTMLVIFGLSLKNYYHVPKPQNQQQ